MSCILMLPSALFQFLMHWFYRNAALIFQLTQKDDEIKHPTLTAVPPVSMICMIQHKSKCLHALAFPSLSQLSVSMLPRLSACQRSIFTLQ